MTSTAIGTLFYGWTSWSDVAPHYPLAAVLWDQECVPCNIRLHADPSSDLLVARDERCLANRRLIGQAPLYGHAPACECRWWSGAFSVWQRLNEEDPHFVEVEGALIVRHSEFDTDWWLIERAEHAGKRWQQPMKQGGIALFTSARLIGHSDIEGTAWEMRLLSYAIIERGYFDANRCGITFDEDLGCFEIRSPRNSWWPARITLQQADALAADIRKKCID